MPAYLGDEPGRQRVEEVLGSAEKAACQVVMCWINLGEVLNLTECRRGLVRTQQVLALSESLPLVLLEPDRDLVLEAAHRKVQYTISYAGAFVVATATREGGIILAGEPEFHTVESIVQIDWLTK